MKIFDNYVTWKYNGFRHKRNNSDAAVCTYGNKARRHNAEQNLGVQRPRFRISGNGRYELKEQNDDMTKGLCKSEPQGF